LSEAEQRFLYDIRRWVRKLFIVINKVDLVTPDERREVLDYIRAGLRQVLGATDVRLHPLSAKQGLEAKLSGNSEALQQSGLPDFEASLAAFLATDKSTTLLVAVLDRALRLLLEQGGGASGDSNISALAVSDQPSGSHDELRRLIQAIETLRTALLDGLRVDQLAPQAQPGAADTEILKREVAASRITPQRIKRDAPQVQTCPICAAESEAVFAFFAHWQYVLSTTAKARGAFAAVRGFCHVHTWQFQQVSSPQGIAEGYVPLVEAVADELRQFADLSPSESAARMRTLLPESRGCPACQVLRDTAQAKVGELLASLGTDRGRADYSQSAGVCLPHLYMILAHEPATEIAELLLRHQAQRLQELSEDMQSFVLKRDARRRGLIDDRERDAWWRALVQLTGERAAQYSWPEKGGDGCLPS